MALTWWSSEAEELGEKLFFKGNVMEEVADTRDELRDGDDSVRESSEVDESPIALQDMVRALLIRVGELQNDVNALKAWARDGKEQWWTQPNGKGALAPE